VDCDSYSDFGQGYLGVVWDFDFGGHSALDHEESSSFLMRLCVKTCSNITNLGGPFRTFSQTNVNGPPLARYFRDSSRREVFQKESTQVFVTVVYWQYDMLYYN